MSSYDYFAISRMVDHMQEMQSKMLSHTSRLRRKSAKSRDEADSELRLYLAAMINILISKNIISQEDFGQVVAAIDGLDGEIDGKLSGEFKGDDRSKPMKAASKAGPLLNWPGR